MSSITGGSSFLKKKNKVRDLQKKLTSVTSQFYYLMYKSFNFINFNN